MELLFVALGGAILGLAAHYAIPRREFRGVVLVPAVGAGVAAVVWVALTWLGMPWDGGWIWVISLVASAAAAAGTGYLVGRRREEDDARTFAHLARFGLARG
ncbi:hypothetical protein GCM10017608_20570 [Agromyces luteolus]|uniref:Integral membrane protein n=1 Tax=Agromyces luteolus TaxID=88373 RepID=A0A7C9HNW5_9MICO|nr:hypothetical protein [Agromyces luteolus]MUN08762.1 hypothetical protein [Agromyces luteolus]GLK28123.1 hypothetical protein GCM10017608_20570 [Agromyces luteolus]